MTTSSTTPGQLDGKTETPSGGGVDEQIAKYQAAADEALAKQNKFTIAKLESDTKLGIGKQRPQF